MDLTSSRNTVVLVVGFFLLGELSLMQEIMVNIKSTGACTEWVVYKYTLYHNKDLSETLLRKT